MCVHLAINRHIMERCELKLSCRLTLVDSEEHQQYKRAAAIRNQFVPWVRSESVHWVQVCAVDVIWNAAETFTGYVVGTCSQSSGASQRAAGWSWVDGTSAANLNCGSGAGGDGCGLWNTGEPK